MPLFADNIRNLHASLIVMALVIAGLVLGKDILIPLALATLIAFMLAPVVRRLASWRVPEGAAVGVVLAVVLGAVVAMSVVLSAQLLSLAEEFPKYRPNLVEKVRMLKAIGSGEGAIKRAADSVESLTAAVSRELADAPAARPAGHPGAVSRTEQPKGADFGAPAGSSTAPSGDPKAPAAAKDGPSAADGLKTVVEPLAKMALTLLFTLFLLLQHQDQRGHGRDDGNGDADQSVLQRLRRNQSLDGFGHQQERRAADEGALHKPGQRLRLAVAETMLAVGRRQRVAHGEQIDEGHDDVERRIHQRGHHGDGTRQQIGDGLDHHQHPAGDHGRQGRTPHQPFVFGNVDLGCGYGHGNRRSVRHG